jgi:hypothetical protein
MPEEYINKYYEPINSMAKALIKNSKLDKDFVGFPVVASLMDEN